MSFPSCARALNLESIKSTPVAPCHRSAISECPRFTSRETPAGSSTFSRFAFRLLLHPTSTLCTGAAI